MELHKHQRLCLQLGHILFLKQLLHSNTQQMYLVILTLDLLVKHSHLMPKVILHSIALGLTLYLVLL
jgi:hypothetical protein